MSTVDATTPDSPVGVYGADHVTVEGTDVEGTIEFYRGVLGLALVLRQPNLDRSDLTPHLRRRRRSPVHLRQRGARPCRPARPATGAGPPPRLSDRRRPDPRDRHGAGGAGHPVSEYDRGALLSLYTEGYSGLVIELVAETFGAPDDRRGEVLALAHGERTADGSEFVRAEHVRTAVEELGIDAEEHDVGDTPAGRDVRVGLAAPRDAEQRHLRPVSNAET